MNEPKRWQNDGAPPAIARALQAAGDERPSAGSLERALASIALGAGVTGAASGAAGAVGAASSGGILLKWTLLGCAVTLSTVGAGLGLGALADAGVPPTAAPAVVRPVVSVPNVATPSTIATGVAGAQSPLDSALEPAPSRTEIEPRRHVDAPKATAALSVQIEDADLLARETRLIERARAERAAGRSAAAITVLDEYERRFPARRYGPEALYLRMEALLALGQLVAARQVATRLATGYPNSPHAARADVVRGKTIP